MFNKFKELSTSVSRRLITYRGKHLGKTIADTKKNTHRGNIVHIGKDSLISSQAIIEQPENIYFGNNVQIKPGVVMRPEKGFIFIGNNMAINHSTVIHAKGGVEIVDWTRIGPHCGIYAQRRDKQLLSLFFACHTSSHGLGSQADLLPEKSLKESVNDVRSNHTVSIIIPVFNQIKPTRKCLETLFANTSGAIYEVIIINNAFTDGTGQFLQSLKKDNFIIITNKKNQGFTKACNQGVEVVSSEFGLFLNNDTEPQPGWLEPLIRVLDRDNSVAAVGSKCLYPELTIQHAGIVIIDDRELPDPLVARHIYRQEPSELGDANELRQYQALTAACLLVRTDAFKQVNGFDEDFWNGYEDIDLCFKLRERGWKLVYQPESVVIHYESVSGKERFSKTDDNKSLLHKKWIGKIAPDFIVDTDGYTKQTDARYIKRYILPEKPLVSIVILTFNQLKFTMECVESIKQYTTEPHEIIFVDNGSTDGTVKWLKEVVST